VTRWITRPKQDFTFKILAVSIQWLRRRKCQQAWCNVGSRSVTLGRSADTSVTLISSSDSIGCIALALDLFRINYEIVKARKEKRARIQSVIFPRVFIPSYISNFQSFPRYLHKSVYNLWYDHMIGFVLNSWLIIKNLILTQWHAVA
jgi:hypothetical protein